MRSVTILEVRGTALSIPTTDPFVISTGEVRATRSALVTVKIRSKFNEDATGIGEAACLPPVTREDQPDVLKAIETGGHQLEGRRIDDLDALGTLLSRSFTHHPVARAGVEMALLDAIAKIEKQPLHSLLSGKREAAPIDTDMTIPILAPERMATLAADWWKKGFRSLKIKVGKNLEADLKALDAMLKVVPDAKFRPDANGKMTVKEALEFAAQAKQRKANLECFEQPCATLEELKAVADALDLPVIADESVRSMAELETLISTKSADGVNLKIAKFGGLIPAREIGLAARKAGLKLMVGGMVESRLGMTAATHLAASLDPIDFADLDTAWLLTEERFTGGYEGVSTYTLPATAGHGVNLK